jgi:hypothetical protein
MINILQPRTSWGMELLLERYYREMAERDTFIEKLAQAQFDRERQQRARVSAPRRRREILSASEVRRLQRATKP